MRRSHRMTVGLAFIMAISLLGTALGRIWGLNGDPKIIAISRNIQISVDKPGQKRELLIPPEPLEFATNLAWDVTIARKSLSTEKIPAGFTIEEVGSTRQVERKTVTGSGNLAVPKGKQYKVTVNAGEYMSIVVKTGAAVKANLTFTEAQIKYTLGDRPFSADFEIAGPAGFTDWRWQWNNTDVSTGKTVSHQFSGEGKTVITVEGSGNTTSGVRSQKYGFEFEVPALVVFNSKIDPLKGPAELTVTASANGVVNYGQKATYNWNFGNGIEISGPEAHNTYLKPGKYRVVLTAKINDYKIEKAWLVEVSPETVLPNLTVTPSLGPVPLKVTGTVNPKISGGPAQLEYSWEIAGTAVKGTSYEHTFTEPGDYQLTVKTVDKLHPDVLIPDEIVLIKALPPQIALKATASIAQGIIPLVVNFDSGQAVTGSPAELAYFWEFGDGETSNLEKPSHTFRQPGEYQVRLTVSDRLHPGNLVDTIIPVTVLPPQLKVTVKVSAADGIAPLEVRFYATTSVTGSPSEPQYHWDFGDGAASAEQNPVHLFGQPGEYQVTVEVKDRYHPAVTDKVTTAIDVKTPKLRLNASVTPNSGPAPLRVKCWVSATEENKEKSGLKITWDFGDGQTAEGPEPTHTYEKAGAYNIQVSVQDEEMGITERKTLKVTVK